MPHPFHDKSIQWANNKWPTNYTNFVSHLLVVVVVVVVVVVGVVDVARAVEWNPVLQKVDDLKFILHVWFIHAFKPAYKVFTPVKQMPIESLVEKRRGGGLHLGFHNMVGREVKPPKAMYPSYYPHWQPRFDWISKHQRLSIIGMKGCHPPNEVDNLHPAKLNQHWHRTWDCDIVYFTILYMEPQVCWAPWVCKHSSQ